MASQKMTKAVRQANGQTLDHAELSRAARLDILTMTSVAGSGHPGGSMSTIDMLFGVLAASDLRPENAGEFYRDHVVVSHGHVSPAVYSALSSFGFIPREELLTTFRLAGSLYQGHVERYIPGVDWTTGNLGQGLAAACGIALALKSGSDQPHFVYVLCGDGEQTKGQIAEARRFARHHNLDNLAVLVDLNDLQISGRTEGIMRTDIGAEYRSAGWQVVEIDAHDHQAIATSLAAARQQGLHCILGRSTMGRGVDFMEGVAKYHGQALGADDHARAIAQLGGISELDHWRKQRAGRRVQIPARSFDAAVLRHDGGARRIYPADAGTDMRSAWGQALVDLGEANRKMMVFDCDLAESVKTKAFAERFPERFVQAGIQEHATATIAGAASTSDHLVFWADYGAFAVDEVYNQHRLNGINHTNLKVVCTHCGIDVGEDGPTHQVVDTIGILRNLPATKILLPADPNQADAMTRFMAAEPGNMFMLMGRSKCPVLTDEGGAPIFGEGYGFTPGAWTIFGAGKDGAVAVWGAMVSQAVVATERVRRAGGPDYAVMAIPSLCAPDRVALDRLAAFPRVLTIEDHWPDTGMGAWLCLTARDAGITCPIRRIGVSQLPFSGKAEDVYRLLKLDADGIAQAIAGEAQR